MTEAEVSRSLSLVGVSGGGEGSVVGEIKDPHREPDAGEVGEIKDPHREPDAGEREVPGSEFDSEAEDDTDLGGESPLKKRKIDSPFVLGNSRQETLS